jgi:hypothetical protein
MGSHIFASKSRAVSFVYQLFPTGRFAMIEKRGVDDSGLLQQR